MPSLNGLSGSLWEGFGAASDPAMAPTFWMAVATFCYTEAGVELKYFVIISLRMYCLYINTSILYTLKHTFFAKKNSISALSRFKQTGVSFRSADLDPGSTPATAQFDQGFAGQFGHLLCRGEGGRSYGSQWQLALGTTKHGTLAFCDLVFSGWETSLTSLTPLFFW